MTRHVRKMPKVGYYRLALQTDGNDTLQRLPTTNIHSILNQKENHPTSRCTIENKLKVVVWTKSKWTNKEWMSLEVVSRISPARAPILVIWNWYKYRGYPSSFSFFKSSKTFIKSNHFILEHSSRKQLLKWFPVLTESMPTVGPGLFNNQSSFYIPVGSFTF